MNNFRSKSTLTATNACDEANRRDRLPLVLPLKNTHLLLTYHAIRTSRATSPGESLLLLDLFSALPSVARSVPTDSAAPAIPISFKNERRSTTRCQRESRVSIGSVAVSVETIVERFSFFTSPTLRSWDRFM